MVKAPTASLRARWLGEWLRDARSKAGYTLADVGEYLQMDHTTLGRFERGTHRIRRSYVKDLIDFYGIADHQVRDALLRLNGDSWRRDWWEGDTSDLELSFIDYTWLEARSAGISIFEPMLVPGLLQTRGYTDSVMAHGKGPESTPEQRSRFVDLRIARQRILHEDTPTQLSAVIEENALSRPVCAPRQLQEQLSHLVNMSHKGHIDIRILPRTVGWHVGVNGPFWLFVMPDPYPNVAYFEGIAVRTFIEDERKVVRYQDAYDELQQLSLSPKASIEKMEHLSKELE